MRRRGERAPKDKVSVAEEEAKGAGRKGEQGTEEYQCTGVLELDLPELCTRAGVPNVPSVTPRPPPSFPAEEDPPEGTLAQTLARIERKFAALRPRVQVEREQDETHGTRAVFLRDWKIRAEALGVLTQCLPLVAGLQALHLWNVGLTPELLPALVALVAQCPSLRTLSLEGNPLPEPAFHLLLGTNSPLAHLRLRSNGITGAGARGLGDSLATNRHLLSLGLSFNRLGDTGASAIAQALRRNRSLLSLSLSANAIGDAGAAALAQVLAPFPLTHAEVVTRRRLLLPQGPSPVSKRSSSLRAKVEPPKPGKTPTRKKEPPRKEEAKPPPKKTLVTAELRPSRSRERRPSAPERPSPEDGGEALDPLLAEAREQGGALGLPGNRALLHLDLSHNSITERGLGALLAALEEQRTGGGLRCLALGNNRVPPTSPALARLQELLPPDPSPTEGAQRPDP